MKLIALFAVAALSAASATAHAAPQPLAPQENYDHLCLLAFDSSPAAASCTLTDYAYTMPGSMCTLSASCRRTGGGANATSIKLPYNISNAVKNCDGVLALRC